MRYQPSKTGAQKLLASKLRAENIMFIENQWLEGWEVDIFLPQYYLVIEIDGFFHLSTGQQARDIQKDQRLTAAGYHVLRFTNTQIYQDSKSCLREIKEMIGSHKLQLKRGSQEEKVKANWQKQLAAYKKKLCAQEEKKQE